MSLLSSQKHVRWPACLSVAKVLEKCTSICSNVICWLELSMKYLRKVSSVAADKLLSDTCGKYVCHGSRGSSGSIVSDYGLDDRGSIPGGGKGFFL
jgi:hypothetical protein